MAMTKTERDNLLGLLVGMFDASPNSALLDQFATSLMGGTSLTDLADDLAATAEFKSIFPVWLTNEEFAERFVAQVLDGNTSEAGVTFAEDYVAGLLNGGSTIGEAAVIATQALMGAEGDPVFGDAAAAFHNKIAVAEYFSLYQLDAATDMALLTAVVDGVGPESTAVAARVAEIEAGLKVDMNPIYLTSETDMVSGTGGSDLFMASLAQNSFAGGVSNTLSSADVIDGGAGTDTLEAVIVNEFVGVTGNDYNIDVQPNTSSVEIVTFEAREGNTGTNTATVTVDAKNMTGVTHIGSLFSDADLVIENLTSATDAGLIRNTREMTITMNHTDSENSDSDASDLYVYFDEDYLIRDTDTGGSTLRFDTVNAVSLAAGENPVAGVIAVRFQVGDELVEVDVTDVADLTVGTDVTSTAAVYQEVVDAVNAQLAAQGLDTVSAQVLTPEEALFSIDFPQLGYDKGDSAGFYSPVLITNTGAEELSPVQIQFNQNLPDSDINATFDDTPAVTENLPLTINVDVEKVGRDGEGGHLVVGGKDFGSEGDGEEDQSDGFEVINLYVSGNEDQPSDMEFISSTDSTLQTVNIIDSATWTGASLRIRDAFNGAATNAEFRNDDNVETVDATQFSGDLTIGDDVAMNNVDTFTATGGGDITVNANIDGDEKGAFTMTTGTGNDDIDVALDGDAVDTVDTSFSINAGSGNNSVRVVMEEAAPVAGAAGVSLNTTRDLNNLSITTSGGVDDIELVGGSTGAADGDAYFTIDAGDGSDFVRIESGDDNGTTQGDATKGTWSIGSLTEPQTWVDRVLYEATLTVSFAGFEQTVTIDTDANGNFIADQITINNAVKAAIAANSELSRLLSTAEGTASQVLTINALVEGHNDLTIAVNQPTVSASVITGNVLTGLQNGLVMTGAAANSAAADTATEIETILATIDLNVTETGAVAAAPNLVLDTGDGTDGTNETTVLNYSTIDMGNGANDLVALNSAVNSVNTLDFTDTWGKVSVVNWFEAQATAGNDNLTDAVTGNHILDFTVWLDDMTSASGSELSAVRTATTATVVNAAAADLDLGTNEVVIFNAFTQNTVESETFALMTAADVDATLEGSDNFGTNAFGNTANAAPGTAYPTGNLNDSILMVQNDLNAGEYKVFNVETDSTAAAGSQHTVTYLGIIDFGETLNAGVAAANFA